MELKRIDRESPDINALERINEEAIPEAERVSLEDMICTGAEVTGIYENGEPAGFLVTRDYRRICYLAFLAVRSDLRSRGLGGQAVRALIRLHPERQTVVEYEAPAEDCASDVTRARRKGFYRRNGFYETGWYTFYDRTEFEVGCSDPEFDAEGFRAFADYLETTVSDHIPRLYRKG